MNKFPKISPQNIRIQAQAFFFVIIKRVLSVYFAWMIKMPNKIIFTKCMNKTFSSMPGSRQIGNYLISKNLGEGTFGKVKLGIHMQTQEKVAIKILEKSKISDVADVERVTRQINILKQVRHPNIIQLYEIIETPKQLFLVMEYVSEGELFEHIVKKKRLKEQEACEFFQQIISGVEYLHELGVVHRDLKPENLLIDFNKRLKLVDFGLSNIYKTKEVLKTACGSPCYAAPEMIAGKKYEGLNADIWSCGIILYAMVCGYLPFQDPNTSALYKKIISGQFSIPKFVSASAKDLIRGILTTDPNRRYTLKTIKSHDWFQLSTSSEFYHFDKHPKGIIPSSHLIPVDQNIIEQMKEYETTAPDEIKRYITNNRHNHVVTVYYLLMKKNLRAGIMSKADFGLADFDHTKLQTKKNEPAASKTKNEETINTERLFQQTRDPNSGKNTSSAHQRNVSRSINRVYLSDFSRNNHVSKKKNQSVQLKLDLDNLPTVIDQSSRIQQRRKLNIKEKPQPKPEDRTSTNFYDIEETFNKFRHTIYPTSKAQPQRQSIHARYPVTFRTSLDRYNKTRQTQRYTSLDTSVQRTSTTTKQKQAMNQTFMGRIPKASTPRWQDQSQRIRSILNKTITGHGNRKKKTINISFN